MLGLRLAYLSIIPALMLVWIALVALESYGKHATAMVMSEP